MTSTWTQSSTLQARVKKLLQSRQEIESSKSLLSTVVASTSNNNDHASNMDTGVVLPIATTQSLAELRKSLRPALEERQSQIAEEALQGLNTTLERIQVLKAQVEGMDDKCTSIHQFLESTQSETKQVQSDAANLSKKRKQVDAQLQRVQAFLNKYEISSDEVAQISKRELQDEDMISFFQTMERIERVKKECESLVSEGSVHCAKELLDSATNARNTGFERLYAWASRKCTEVDGEPSSELHRAISILRGHAEFYNHCKESITAARQSLNVRRFITALTRGGPNGIPRPIEMHAHDPERYCGDMLAWVHQGIASETEFFRLLFDGDLSHPLHSAQNEAPSHSAQDGEQEQSMIAVAFEGVASPLQVRLEQTLSSYLDVVHASKLVHLLGFYQFKFSQLLPFSTLANVLSQCRQSASQTFHQEFDALVESVATATSEYSSNVGAAPVIVELSHRLAALLAVAQTSMLNEDEREKELKPLWGKVLPALHTMCAGFAQDLSPSDAFVMQINNFTSVEAAIKPYGDAKDWVSALRVEVEGWKTDLSKMEADAFQQKCRVDKILQGIDKYRKQTTGGHPWDVASELQPQMVGGVMQLFAKALLRLHLPQIERISQQHDREAARQLAVARLAETYDLVYDFVQDEEQEYNVVTSSSMAEDKSNVVVIPRTPQEIRTVLELD